VSVTERRTQAERRATTRAALMAAGRRLFAERGYDNVSSEDIVAAAGVTRGALYHHFDGKRGLFAAVYEEVEAEFVSRFDFSAPEDEAHVERIRYRMDFRSRAQIAAWYVATGAN